MEYKCQFCEKNFANKSNLNAHVKTAKKCIMNRDVKSEIINFVCEFCNKNFSSRTSINYHKNICPEVKFNVRIKEFDNKINQLETQIIEKDLFLKQYLTKIEDQKQVYEKQIQDLKETILRLEKTNKELALKAIERPTNVTHNKTDNHSINNNTYNNLQPVNLSPDYIYQVFDQNQ
jgi:hypothetical protein